jgi:hypothetical protein
MTPAPAMHRVAIALRLAGLVSILAITLMRLRRAASDE